jgi:hypothetical protein
VESREAFDTPLVTADDDFLYPRYWLKMLILANRAYQDSVNCYWAKVIPINDGLIENFKKWGNCGCTTPSYRHQAVGQMGVIYPTRLLIALQRAGTGFEACCPRADDIWLHVQALRAGYKVRQIVPRLPYFSFQGVPNTQQTALSYENVTADGNDRQIAATYTDGDIQILLADGGVGSGEAKDAVGAYRA